MMSHDEETEQPSHLYIVPSADESNVAEVEGVVDPDGPDPSDQYDEEDDWNDWDDDDEWDDDDDDDWDHIFGYDEVDEDDDNSEEEDSLFRWPVEAGSESLTLGDIDPLDILATFGGPEDDLPF